MYAFWQLKLSTYDCFLSKSVEKLRRLDQKIKDHVYSRTLYVFLKMTEDMLIFKFIKSYFKQR